MKQKKALQPEPRRYLVNIEMQVEVYVEAEDKDKAIENAFDNLSAALGGTKIKRWWWNRVEEEVQE